MDERQPSGAEPDAWAMESEGHASGAPTPPERDRGRGGKKLVWALIAVVVAFLAGFGWQYYEARAIAEQLEQTEQELAVERLRVGLAQAAVAAQSGDFETARQQMSEFFTATQARLPELTPELRRAAEDMLRSRDDVITGLSRANPESADVLYGMLMRFRTSAAPEAPVPAAPADTTSPAG